MKKANRIIRDLKEVQKKYGVDHDWTIEVIEELKKYEINFNSFFPNVEGVVDLEDHPLFSWCELRNDYRTNKIASAFQPRLEDRYNSYNSSCPVTFIYQEINTYDNSYVVVSFHRWGDVRWNYSEQMILDVNMELFMEIMMDISFYKEVKVDGEIFDLSQNVLSEYGVVEILSEDGGKYWEGYCDADWDNDDEMANFMRRLIKDGEM